MINPTTMYIVVIVVASAEPLSRQRAINYKLTFIDTTSKNLLSVSGLGMKTSMPAFVHSINIVLLTSEDNATIFW